MTITTDINFYAIIEDDKSFPPVVYYTNPDEVIVFGSFSIGECQRFQGITPTTPKKTTVSTQTTLNGSVYPLPSSLYYSQPIPCSRCGHMSHQIDQCVARRNINGERIIDRHYSTPKKTDKYKIYPQSPTSPTNDIHYYNTHIIQNGWCEGDKTDYNDFVFTSDDVYDWIDEQQQLFVPPLPPVEPEQPTVVYVPITFRNKTRYAPVMIPSPDQEIEYILRYNYAMTNYMIGRQAAYVCF